MTLSILIPVYNTGRWLPRCLDSLLGQERLPDEILLVDDGSTDGTTPALCDDYARRHPERIRAVHVPNGGVGAARNACLREARGDYVLFVDSDDAVSPRLVSSLTPWMARGIDGAVFDYQIDFDGRLLPSPEELPAGPVTSLAESPELFFLSPCPWNKLWRRALFTENGLRFPEGILFEDLSLIPRLYALAERIAVIREPLYFYTERGGSIMRSRAPERDREVLTALDGLLDWYRQAGLYERCRPQLEALAVKHALLAASVRVTKADPASPVLGELAAWVEERFPAWRQNPCVRALPARHKLVLRLLEGRRYRLIRRLFLLKDRQKAGGTKKHERLQQKR